MSLIFLAFIGVSIYPKYLFDDLVDDKIFLKSDVTVIATGLYDAGGDLDLTNWTNMMSVEANSMHTVGLKSDGTVVAVGNNDSGQCNVEDWTNIIAVSAELGYTVGLKSDGTIVYAGENVKYECDNYVDEDIVSVHIR